MVVSSALPLSEAPRSARNEFPKSCNTLCGLCLAGKSLYRTGATNGYTGYIGYIGAHFRDAATEKHATRMQQRLEALERRAQYGQRFATVEPVFANVRYNKRLDRFTLPGRSEVNGR